MREIADLGVRPVPLDHIVGSWSRASDFDLTFSPLRESLNRRSDSVAGAVAAGMRLPPVELLKILSAYFVVDGHHRISVSRRSGSRTIRSHVLELDGSRLEPDSACTRLGFRV